MKRHANDQMIANSRKRNNQNQNQNNSYNQHQQYTPEMENSTNNYNFEQKYNSQTSQAQNYSPAPNDQYAFNYYFPGSPYNHSSSGGWTAPPVPITPSPVPPPLPKGPPPGSPYYNPIQPPPLPPTRHPSESTPPLPPSSSQSNSSYSSNNSNKTWNRKFVKNNFDSNSNNSTRSNFDYSKMNFQKLDYGINSLGLTPNILYSSTPIPEVAVVPPVTEVEKVIKVNKKPKRKPMSSRMNHKKEWNREDAIKALQLEQEFNKMQKLPMLILKFPDPDVNKEIVRGYSTSIENVHFQQPSTSRYCFVQLHPDANIEEVKAHISSIPFGTGFIQVERKNSRDEEEGLPPEDLDPYTLYIGNLPTTISVAAVKEKFPTAHRIDIGYAQRMKNTRYAFVRYETVDDALLAYRQTFNLIIESRTIIVRFRRQKGTVNIPGDPRFTTNFPPRIPLALKKSSDLLQSVSEIDFMEDTFIDHEVEEIETEDMINDSVDADVEEIETEDVINNGVDADVEEIEDVEEEIESVVNNQENTNRVNITDTKQNIIKTTESNVGDKNSNVIDSTLIKTEIKDEPKDDVECGCEEVEDDDLDVEPISSEDGEDEVEESEDGEEDTDSDAETNKPENTSMDNQHVSYWDKLKLDEQNDVKPDIAKIRILNSDTINELADQGINRLLDPNLLKITDPEKNNEDEELAALYNNLNPDENIF